MAAFLDIERRRRANKNDLVLFLAIIFVKSSFKTKIILKLNKLNSY